MSARSTTLLRRAFVDICRGYSVGHIKDGQPVYIRHIGHLDHASYEDEQARFEQEAQLQGAQTEAQRLEDLYTKGMWTPAREAEIEQKRDFIIRLEDGRKTIAVPSILLNHEAQITREREALARILTERAHVIRDTAETYAQRRLEDYYLVHNLFTDKGLTTLVYTEEDFDNLGDTEVDVVHAIYQEVTERCADTNLRRMAVQDFFFSYWSLAKDDAQVFYGRAVCELTYYQVKLCNFARYMKLLIDNTDLSRLTPEQRVDPDVIERLNITQRNAATIQAKGEVPVGLTAADMKETGQQYSQAPPPGLSGIELVKWLRKQRPPS